MLKTLGEQRGSTVAVSLLIVVSILVFAFTYHSASTALVAVIPIYIFIVAAIVAVLLAIVLSLPVGDTNWLMDKNFQGASQSLIIVILLSAGLILTLSAIFCWTCLTPRPLERFEDLSVSGIQADVAAAEVDVCKYITRADQFIKSDVGPAGTKDPSLVTAAEAKAREGIDVVLCSDGVPVASGLDPSAGELAIRADLENRIARLESTVTGLTGVVFKRAYDETVPCKEGFVAAAAVPSVAELQARVNAVRTTVAEQKTKYLDPIDQKTADLQAGRASDCDKRRGAKLSAAGGPKAATE